MLLAEKKRGFGAGKLNGPGGKVQEGETVPASAAREVSEEVGVEIEESDLVLAGELKFFFPENPDWNQDCDIFIINKWRGNPEESEEMKPFWFSLDALPYEKMWVSDRKWLPEILAGNIISAEITFFGNGERCEDFEIKKLGRWK